MAKRGGWGEAKLDNEPQPQEVSTSSYVVNLIAAVVLGVLVALIAAVVLGVLVALIAVFVLGAVGLAVATAPRDQWTSTDDMMVMGTTLLILAVTGLIYYGMFRKLRPRRRSRT